MRPSWFRNVLREAPGSIASAVRALSLFGIALSIAAIDGRGGLLITWCAALCALLLFVEKTCRNPKAGRTSEHTASVLSIVGGSLVGQSFVLPTGASLAP
jgi:hypothetical protein